MVELLLIAAGLILATKAKPAAVGKPDQAPPPPPAQKLHAGQTDVNGDSVVLFRPRPGEGNARDRAILIKDGTGDGGDLEARLVRDRQPVQLPAFTDLGSRDGHSAQAAAGTVAGAGAAAAAGALGLGPAAPIVGKVITGIVAGAASALGLGETRLSPQELAYASAPPGTGFGGFDLQKLLAVENADGSKMLGDPSRGTDVMVGGSYGRPTSKNPVVASPRSKDTYASDFRSME